MTDQGRQGRVHLPISPAARAVTASPARRPHFLGLPLALPAALWLSVGLGFGLAACSDTPAGPGTGLPDLDVGLDSNGGGEVTGDAGDIGADTPAPSDVDVADAADGEAPDTADDDGSDTSGDGGPQDAGDVADSSADTLADGGSDTSGDGGAPDADDVTEDTGPDADATTLPDVSGVPCATSVECEIQAEQLGFDVSCVDATCGADKQCAFAPKTGPCDDGNVCTTGETCEGFQCTGGTPKCDDGEPCTVDVCDGATGTCTHTPEDVGTACNDQRDCTYADICRAGGVCGGIPTPQCTCDQDADCDGMIVDDLCLAGPHCGPSGYCEGDPATAMACPTGADTDCRVNQCDPAVGLCAMTPINEGEACLGQGVCGSVGTCQSGECVADADPCDDGDPCTADTCHPVDGCIHSPVSVACDDGDPCTQLDNCSTGVCAGVALDCDDSNPCTLNSCVDGGCVTANTAAACDDGDPCTITDTCQGGTCVGGDGPDCDDHDVCTLDTCSPVGDAYECKHGPAPTGAAGECSDGDPCTDGDFCAFGACQAGVNVCGDCSIDADCADFQPGNLCVSGWLCDKSGPTPTCVPDPANSVQCTPNETACTIDQCNPATGTCQPTPKPAGTPCDDGNACTLDEVCTDGGGCASPSPNLCDDGNDCTSDACVDGQCESVPLTGGAVYVDEHFDGGLPGGWQTQSSNPSVGWVADASYDAAGAPNSQGISAVGSDGTYDYGVTTALLMLPAAQYSGQTIYLTFRMKADFGDAAQPFDACFPTRDNFAVIVQHGGISDQVYCKSNDVPQWTTVTVPLPTFADQSQVALQFHSNGDNNATSGVQIDDLRIESTFTCTVDAICQDGLCQDGACQPHPRVCDDDDPCTADSCDPETDQCVFVPGPCGCTSDTECATTDPCLHGICGADGFCTTVATTATCDDGDICTDNDTCSGGVCVGEALSCDDSDPCTLDQCVPTTGCENTPATLPCDDGDLCTYDDTCTVDGVCAGVEVTCTGGCLTGSCDPSSGECNLTDILHDGSLLLSESFETTAPGAVPSGWTAASTDASWAWQVDSSSSVSEPNSLVLLGPGAGPVATVTVTSPALTLPADGGTLELQLWTDMSASYNGPCPSDNDHLAISVGGQVVYDQCADTAGFQAVSIPLDAAAFGGKDGTVALAFTTGAGSSALVYVDDVKVLGHYYCDDGDPCTTPDTCMFGMCVGTPVTGTPGCP